MKLELVHGRVAFRPKCHLFVFRLHHFFPMNSTCPVASHEFVILSFSVIRSTDQAGLLFVTVKSLSMTNDFGEFGEVSKFQS